MMSDAEVAAYDAERTLRGERCQNCMYWGHSRAGNLGCQRSRLLGERPPAVQLPPVEVILPRTPTCEGYWCSGWDAHEEEFESQASAIGYSPWGF